MRATIIVVSALIVAVFITTPGVAIADTCAASCEKTYASCSKSCRQSDTNCFTKCINEKESCIVQCKWVVTVPHREVIAALPSPDGEFGAARTSGARCTGTRGKAGFTPI